MSRLTFQVVGDSRDNNFDFLRFLMASMVIYAHSFAVLYNGTLKGNDPLNRLTKWQVGYGGLAVQCFFLMSGYLVTRSWFYSSGWRDYARKRILRILPGLIATLLFCVFVIGPLASSLSTPAYFTNLKTYRFLGILFFVHIKANDRLPGVFTQNPMPGSVNGPLWSIRYEAICYVLVAVLGLLGTYRKPARVIALCAVCFAVSVLNRIGVFHMGEFDQFPNLATYFLLGALCYLFRERVPYSHGLFALSVLALVVSASFGLLPYVQPLFAAYALFYVAFSRGLRLLHFARFGDLSYGVYIYGLPIQQILIEYFPGAFTANTHFLASLLVTCGCAALSWHYIELPFLRLKRKPQAPSREIMRDSEPVTVQ
jgi:peptidoglycan/LPS O-acetylase OafA/YrhL